MNNAQQIYNKAFIESNSQKNLQILLKKFLVTFAFGAYKVKEQDLTLHFNKETNLKKKIDFLIRMVKQSNQQNISQNISEILPKESNEKPEISSTNEKPEISSATNEKKLTLYIGISGSGKSREAQKYQDAVEINRDRLRFYYFVTELRIGKNINLQNQMKILLQKNVLKYGNRLF